MISYTPELLNKALKITPDDVKKPNLSILTRLWRTWCVSAYLTKNVADELVVEYCNTEFTGQKAKNKLANFPRLIWQRPNLSWDTLREIAVALQSETAEFAIEVIHPDKPTVTVGVDLLEEPNVGGEPITLNLKHAIPDSLIIYSPSVYEAVETWEAYLLRKILFEYKVTWKDLDKALTKYVARKDIKNSNSHLSATSLKQRIKSHIKSPKLNWYRLLTILDVLGFYDYDLVLLMDHRYSKPVLVHIAHRW